MERSGLHDFEALWLTLPSAAVTELFPLVRRSTLLQGGVLNASSSVHPHEQQRLRQYQGIWTRTTDSFMNRTPSRCEFCLKKGPRFTAAAAPIALDLPSPLDRLELGVLFDNALSIFALLC